MFEKYSKLMLNLDNFEKEVILNKKFELYNKSNLKIYYAPHNEITNKKAKIFIVGITPGWTQTSIAYKTAHEALKKGLDYEYVKIMCKKQSRFAGSMRKNLIDMLDELNLNNILSINSCSELFEDKDYLLHTTSIIPYPVFINGKNYTGHNPKILDSEILFSYVKKYFYKEVEALPNALIIPLGMSAEEVLNEMIKNNLISKERCLFGFSHPSGANGHRKKQFENNKKQLEEKIKLFFNSNSNKQL